MIETLEDRRLLTITYNVPVGHTLDINPVNFMRGAPFDGNFNRMEVRLSSVPGVNFGQIYKVDGTQAYVWGSSDPNPFSPAVFPGFSQNRIHAGQGFRYVNDGSGLGQSESIPVRFVRRNDFSEDRVDETLVINITSGVGAPEITQQPDPYEPLAPGQPYTLTVAATGNGPLTYQWFRGLAPNSSQPIAGGTSSSLVVTGAPTPTGNNESDHYWVQVSNSVGDANSHTVTINTSYPPVALPGGPYDVSEGGGTVMLQGAHEGAVTFGWDFNNDNFFGGPNTSFGSEDGLTPIFNSLPDDDGPGATYTVRLRVVNQIDFAATASTTIRVVNVAPTAAFRSNGAGGVVAFSEQYDPSAADRAAGYTYSYDFNNDGVFDVAGSPDASAAVPAQHMSGYLAGTYVRGRITDKDGGSRDYLASVDGRILVVNASDNATGQRQAYIGAPLSLRSAIEIAESDAAPDKIIFDPSLYAAGSATINVDSPASGAPAFTVNTPLIISGPVGNPGVALAPADTGRPFRAFNVGPNGQLTLERMTIRNFSASEIGGAVYNQGRLTIRSSTFNNNKTASGQGGAIFNDGGVVTAVTSTFWQNTAEQAGGLGGAIFSRNGSVELTHVTASENIAAGGGRDLYLLSDGAGNAASAVVRNSILGQFDASVADFAAGAANGGATPTSSGFNNLIRNGPAFGGSASNADPRVAGLVQGAGPTPTGILYLDSPAVDSGAAIAGIAVDQRGIAHFGSPDIGAYEQTESLVVTTQADEDDGSSDPRLGSGTSLREAIGFAQRLPGPDTVTFAPGMAGRRIDLRIQQGSAFFPAAIVTDTDITIQGFATGPTVTIARASDAPKMGLFYEQYANLTLNDLILADGDSGRGGAVQQGFISSATTVLRVNRCTFINNRAQGGGAISAGNCFINDSTFVNNTALLGGAIYQSNLGGFSRGVITQCTFVGNGATPADDAVYGSIGGAIYITNGSVRQSTIVGNKTFSVFNYPGGALVTSIQTNVPVLLENNLIAGNTGGDILVEQGAQPLSADSRNNLIGVGGAGGLVDGVNGNIVGVADPGVFELADNGGRTQTVALRPGSRAINTAATIDGVTSDQRGLARPQYFAPDIGAYEFNSYATPVNDAPTFSFPSNPPASNEDAGLQTVPNFLRNISPGPSDEADQTLTFNITATGGTGLTFAVAPAINPQTGALTYQSAPNSYGSATFSVKLTDNGPSNFPNANTSATRTFTITVNPVNDAPAAANPLADRTAVVDAPFEFTPPSNTFIDPDAGDSLSYSATQVDSPFLPSWLNFDPSSRTFRGTPTAPGKYYLRYIASDGNTSTADEFTLEVLKRLSLTPASNQVGLTGVSSAFNLGSFTDVDPAAGPWNVSVDWGDGSTPTAYQLGQNLLQASTALEQDVWSKSRAIVQSYAGLAPDGTYSANKLIADNSNAQHLISQGIYKPSQSLRYTLSLYVKDAGNGSATAYLGDEAGNYAAASFNLSSQTTTRRIYGSGMAAESSSITPVGDGWYLVTLTAQTTANNRLRAYLFPNTNTSFSGNSNSGVYVWNVRLGQAIPPTLAAEAHRYNESGSYNVRITVANRNGRTDEAGFRVDAKRVALTTPANQSAAPGSSTSFNLGSFVDANPGAGPWDVSVDWGDGSAPTAYQFGQNLLQASNALDQTVWGKNNAFVQPYAAVAPDGTQTAAKLIPGYGYSQHMIQQGISKPAESSRYTLSLYVKAAEQNSTTIYLGDEAGNYAAASFNLANQTTTRRNYGSGMIAESSSIAPVGDGWYLVTLTAQTTATKRLRAYLFPNTNASFTGDGYSGIYVWNVRLGQAIPPTLGTNTHFYNRIGDYRVRITVKNRLGEIDAGSFDVNVAGSTPQVTAAPNQSASAGTITNFELGSFTDADPWAGPWNVSVDWGDGSAPTAYQLGQNLLQAPDDLDQAAWGKNRVFVQANAAIAPDGTQTADKVIADGANAQHVMYQRVYKPSQSLRYTLSLYVKDAGNSSFTAYLGDEAGNYAAASFNLSGQSTTRRNYGSGMVAESSSITPVGDGWYLVTLTAQTTATNRLGAYLFPNSNSSFAGDYANGLYAWGMRLGQAIPPTLGTSSHRYAQAGNYNVRVTVTNRYGNSASQIFVVNVSASFISFKADLHDESEISVL